MTKNRRRRRYIRVTAPKICGTRLLFKLDYSRKLKAYFSSDRFYVEYDEDIDSVDESILYIPVVSALIPFAWATGADIYVRKLDKTFLESLTKVKMVMKKWYPMLPFSTKVNVKEAILSRSSGTKYGLLFSGGIDSTTSYIRHRDKRPNLIMICGADVPLSKKEFWKRIKMEYKSFADEEGVDINFIKTNMRQFLNEKLLDAEFGRYGSDLSWWGSFYHGIALLGLCAPLTIAKHIGNLLIASTYTHKFKYPWGSHPLIDENISWADIKVIHDGYNLSRQEKIRYILKRFINGYGRYPPLRVCYSQSQYFNCNRCIKCYLSIIGLTLEGIDPNKCGFNIGSEFFVALKKDFIKGKLKLSDDYFFLFRDIQEHIPEKLDHDLYYSKEFFEWFKNYDLRRNYKKHRIKSLALLSLYRIYYRLPKSFQNVIFTLNALFYFTLRRVS